MPAVNIQPVSGSSFIAGIGYDPDEETLGVQFTDGKVYYYANVPEGVYHSFAGSGSMGQFYHANIKGNYVSTPG